MWWKNIAFASFWQNKHQHEAEVIKYIELHVNKKKTKDIWHGIKLNDEKNTVLGNAYLPIR